MWKWLWYSLHRLIEGVCAKTSNKNTNKCFGLILFWCGRYCKFRTFISCIYTSKLYHTAVATGSNSSSLALGIRFILICTVLERHFSAPSQAYTWILASCFSLSTLFVSSSTKTQLPELVNILNYHQIQLSPVHRWSANQWRHSW